MSKVLSFEQEFTRSFDDLAHILRHVREAIGVTETQWSDLTKVNLIRVANHIKTKVSSNSARTYFAVLCGFIHKYEDEGIVPCRHPEEVLKAKKEPQQGIYLTEEEIKRIEKYYDDLMTKQRHQPEKDCLTLFLIEMYTGARFSDCECFSTNNLKDGRLTYTSIKTSILTEVPEHRRLQELIERLPERRYANSTVNRALKRVAKKVGINQPTTIFTRGKLRTAPKYEFVSTHVGRKSFVTNLANRGVDIYTISAYAGHKSVLQTDHYIVRDTIKTPEEALSFFND